MTDTTKAVEGSAPAPEANAESLFLEMFGAESPSLDADEAPEAADRSDEDRDQGHNTDDTPDDTTPEADPAALQAALEAERQAKAKLELDRKADIGRVAALRKRVAELEAQQRNPRAAEYQPPEELTRTADDYPEVAGPMIGVVKQLGQQISAMTAAQQSQAALSAAREELRLEEIEPGWGSFVGQRLGEFRTWLDDQPRAIREAGYRNAQAVVSADEAATVIRRFREHVEGASSPQAQPPQADPKDAARRQRQLAATASPRGASRPVASGIPEDGDPEALFKMMHRQGLF